MEGPCRSSEEHINKMFSFRVQSIVLLNEGYIAVIILFIVSPIVSVIAPKYVDYVMRYAPKQ